MNENFLRIVESLLRGNYDYSLPENAEDLMLDARTIYDKSISESTAIAANKYRKREVLE